MKRRSLLAAVLMVGATIVAGSVAGRAFADKANPEKIRVALLPDENASTIIQNAQPLKAHLPREEVRMCYPH